MAAGAGAGDLAVIDAGARPVCRHMTIIATVARGDMVSRFTGRGRPIMAADAGAGDLAVIDADARPVCRHMTIIAAIA